MHELRRELAQEHIADLRRTAERRRMVLLARCCCEVARFFSRVRDGFAGKPGR